MSTAVLNREAFAVSRSLDFCNKKQLTVETGHAPEEWPLVILKELIDNSLDACEEAGIAPEINIQVSTELEGGAGEIAGLAALKRWWPGDPAAAVLKSAPYGRTFRFDRVVLGDFVPRSLRRSKVCIMQIYSLHNANDLPSRCG